MPTYIANKYPLIWNGNELKANTQPRPTYRAKQTYQTAHRYKQKNQKWINLLICLSLLSQWNKSRAIYVALLQNKIQRDTHFSLFGYPSIFEKADSITFTNIELLLSIEELVSVKNMRKKLLTSDNTDKVEQNKLCTS